jgi:hypothetical protein
MYGTHKYTLWAKWTTQRSCYALHSWWQTLTESQPLSRHYVTVLSSSLQLHQGHNKYKYSPWHTGYPPTIFISTYLNKATRTIPIGAAYLESELQTWHEYERLHTRHETSYRFRMNVITRIDGKQCWIRYVMLAMNTSTGNWKAAEQNTATDFRQWPCQTFIYSYWPCSKWAGICRYTIPKLIVPKY